MLIPGQPELAKGREGKKEGMKQAGRQRDCVSRHQNLICYRIAILLSVKPDVYQEWGRLFVMVGVPG